MGKSHVTVKPRIRVPAGSARVKGAYLRDTRSGVVNTRASYLRDSRDEIRVAWRRAAGIALDLIQNSGQLRGGADQVIADTVGAELVLNPQPDLSVFGFSAEDTIALCKLIKEEWKRWAWNPRECDLRGKFTVPQQVDTALRADMAFGEALGRIAYMGPVMRRRYGLRSGTKLCMITPTSLVQDTSDVEGLYQGVIHDENGRPSHYRIQEREAGLPVKRDYPCFDQAGRQLVVHAFDPMDAADVRGISRLASAFRTHIQREILVDTTIQTAILQTVFAAALTSPEPSKDAFEAIEALRGDDSDALGDEFRDYFLSALDRAAESKISISGSPTVSHLAPGEKLDLLTTQTPGPQFLTTNRELSRETARAIGISFGGLTMNHENASYSSVRMETASIWPVVTRRRERIAAPICQATYESWLDEWIGTGRIPFAPGYQAYREHRERVNWALWQGPAKPSADDGKSAKASSERIFNGTTTLADECAELGRDPEEVFEQRRREHDRYRAAGMPSPFERKPDSGATKEEEDPALARQREAA